MDERETAPVPLSTSPGAEGLSGHRALRRRQFLELSGAVVGGAVLSQTLPLNLLRPLAVVDNPLEAYPDRGWEKIYRDQYRYDSSFTFVCSPNDTHHCRMRAFVRNGVIMRIEQNYVLFLSEKGPSFSLKRDPPPRGVASYDSSDASGFPGGPLSRKTSFKPPMR